MEILNTFRTSISSATMLLRQVDQVIVIMKKTNKACNIIELIPGNVQLNKKKFFDKYQEVKHEIKRSWGVRNVDIILVIVRAVANVTKNLGELGMLIQTFTQKYSLLWTASVTVYL